MFSLLLLAAVSTDQVVRPDQPGVGGSGGESARAGSTRRTHMEQAWHLLQVVATRLAAATATDDNDDDDDDIGPEL